MVAVCILSGLQARYEHCTPVFGVFCYLRAIVAARLANMKEGGTGANQYSSSANLQSCYISQSEAAAMLAQMPKQDGGDAMKARSHLVTEVLPPTLADLGKRIVTDSEYKKWEQGIAGGVLQRVAKAVEISERTLYYAVQFYEKFSENRSIIT